MLTASSDLKVTSFLFFQYWDSNLLHSGKLTKLAERSTILMISTRKNGGFSIAMWVYQSASVAITLLSAYQVLFGIYPTTGWQTRVIWLQILVFSILGLLNKPKSAEMGNKTIQTKNSPTQKFGSPSPHKKKTNMFNTNKEFLQVAMFSIFLALAAKRKELNVSEQCSCDGLGGKPRWQKPFEGTWRIIPVSKWLVTPI